MRLLILRSHYPPRRKICDVKVCQRKRIRDHSVARVNCRDARKRTRNHSRCLAIRVGHRPDKTIVASSSCAKIVATLINSGSAAQNHSLLQTFGRGAVHLTWNASGAVTSSYRRKRRCFTSPLRTRPRTSAFGFPEKDRRPASWRFIVVWLDEMALLRISGICAIRKLWNPVCLRRDDLKRIPNRQEICSNDVTSLTG
jgi:hypothetical protein